MKHNENIAVLFGIVLFFTTFLWTYVDLTQSRAEKLQRDRSNKFKEILLTSDAFANESTIPMEFTCDGENINPPLTISNIPKDTKSMALLVEDPDAPNGLFVHWVLWNIQPSTIHIEKNSSPDKAIVGINSENTKSYKGPCPEQGTHRYYFRIYALRDQMLPADNGSRDELLSALNGRIISEASIIGIYTRK